MNFKIQNTLMSVFVSSLILSQCSTDKEVKEVDTQLEKKGTYGGKSIGLNEDDEAVIQEEIAAGDELRRQQWVNNQLEENLKAERSELKRCRNDLSDPRLGGNGDLAEIPEIDQIKSPNEVKEELGVTSDGSLRVVKKQYLADKLKSEKKFERSLRGLVRLVKKHRESCDRKMSNARVKAGLPAKRFRALGSYDASGNWNQTRRAEMTLDDAFEILGKQKAKK